jgi:acetophenone carboxylase
LVRLTARHALPGLERAAVPAATNGTGPGERGGLPTRSWASVAGSTVTGPALVDGGSFTWLVGAGWSLAVDGSGDAVATKESS